MRWRKGFCEGFCEGFGWFVSLGRGLRIGGLGFGGVGSGGVVGVVGLVEWESLRVGFVFEWVVDAFCVCAFFQE